MFVRATQVAIAIALVAASQPAFAEEPSEAPASAAPGDANAPAPKPSVVLDAAPAVALPYGDLVNATGPALGGMFGLSYSLDDRWDFVAQGGYLAGATASYQLAGVTASSSLSYAPMLAGVRYYFSGPAFVRLFALAESGVVVVNGSSSASSGVGSSMTSGVSPYIGGSASIGMQFDILELRAGLLTADIGHPGTSTSGLLSLGFRFASL